MESFMHGCLRCPQCHLLPELEIDTEAHYAFELFCERHGFRARGKTPFETVSHWNRFIENVVTAQTPILRGGRESPTARLVFNALHGIDRHE